jgi:hypothetical protein
VRSAMASYLSLSFSLSLSLSPLRARVLCVRWGAEERRRSAFGELLVGEMMCIAIRAGGWTAMFRESTHETGIRKLLPVIRVNASVLMTCRFDFYRTIEA